MTKDGPVRVTYSADRDPRLRRVLADGVVGPEGAQRVGQTMLTEAAHLDRLVSDRLALARLETADFALEPMPVDLTRLVTDAAEAWGRGRWRRACCCIRRSRPSTYTDPGCNR